VILGFGAGLGYELTGVVIDPAATGGHPAKNDLKHFQIWVSTTGTEDSDFTQVLSGQTKKKAALQSFSFPTAVPARYVKLEALDNYGGNAIDVAELEVVSPSLTSSLPTLTPTVPAAATSLPVYTPTASATPSPTLSPTATSVATPTDTPVGKPTFIPTPPGSATNTPTAGGNSGVYTKTYKATYTPVVGACPAPALPSDTLTSTYDSNKNAISISSGKGSFSGPTRGGRFTATSGGGYPQYVGDVDTTGNLSSVSFFTQNPASGCVAQYSVTLS
jgi:hypothetical protein